MGRCRRIRRAAASETAPADAPAGLAYTLYLTDANRPSAVAFTTSEYDIRPSTQLATSAWTHLATTYDGCAAPVRQVDGALVSSRAMSGALAVSSGALRIGGNAIWDEFFAARLDDVRVCGRALSGGEIQVDMNTPVANSDTQAPSAPGDLTAGVSNVKQVDLSWTAATDDRAVTGYRVHRSLVAPRQGRRVLGDGGPQRRELGVPVEPAEGQLHARRQRRVADRAVGGGRRRRPLGLGRPTGGNLPVVAYTIHRGTTPNFPTTATGIRPASPTARM